eukprot:COSAG02_NODE_1328_length_13219_cov_45.612652_5_plen_65_part_00
MRTKPCPVASHLQLIHYTLHNLLVAPLVAQHHVSLVMTEPYTILIRSSVRQCCKSRLCMVSCRL